MSARARQDRDRPLVRHPHRTPPGSIKCYLDGKLIHDVPACAGLSIYACAGLKNDTGEIIVKVVNTPGNRRRRRSTSVAPQTWPPTGRAIVLTSASGKDENTFDSPTKIVPREESIKGVGTTIRRTLPGNWITVLRLGRQKN